MVAAANMVEIAALVGDTARATMLAALMGGQALTSSELASLAHISRSTASGHLNRLVNARLLAVTQKRRNRYYRIASPLVARMLESIKTVAAIETPARHQPRSARDDALRFARTCYDHVAGELGVAIADALITRGFLVLTEEGGEVTKAGARFFRQFGADLEFAGRRPEDFLSRLPRLERAALPRRRICRRGNLAPLSGAGLACPAARHARDQRYTCRAARLSRHARGRSGFCAGW